jgi:hypothetical protein
VWQEILITDLTLMKGGRVCFAGIDHQGITYRPEPSHEGVFFEHLFQDGRPIIYPRSVLKMDLEAVAKIKPPHTEDHDWKQVDKTSPLYVTTDAKWRTALERTAFTTALDAYGVELDDGKRLTPGQGVRSLATLQLIEPPIFYCRPKPSNENEFDYRISFTDSSGAKFQWIPITDLTLRTYVDWQSKQGGYTPGQTSYRLSQFFKSAVIFLRLGFSRPFRRTSASEPYCYLQVNGIYTFPDYLRGKTYADLFVE